MILFTDKYNPKKLSEVIGHDLELEKLGEFVLDYKKQKKKAILIYGKSGTGKTCSVYALANDLNLELLDVNASEFRNKEIIDYLVGNFIKQFSLFGKQKLIFIDELEGISGQQDRGGLQALQELIEISNIPIIISANEIEEEKLEKIRKKSELLEFKSLDNDLILKYLEKICNKEKINLSKENIKSVVENSNGDLRAALIDLQVLSSKNNVSEQDLIFDKRILKIEPSKFVKEFFDKGSLQESYDLLENMDISFYEGPGPVIFSEDNSVLYWIEENLPRKINNNDLAEAYYYLSKADVFKGRILRQQYWRFLVYQKSLLAGINNIKDKKLGFDYKKTRRSPKQNFFLWALVNRRRNTIAEKFSKKLHTSKKDFIKDALPYLKVVFKNNKYHGIAEEFGLEKEEVEYIKKI